ncbi:hypothetical protein M427DRAFT_159541 [Gonapodya prolifera JEL478]|uniref:SH3 domain-containing protein n=1 Tax=Gonapodya prolifera (strain JEL478) TaxID=1344416 RepID=A0A139A0I7_GONPJ|nr:hypothetical protein M427DRAFT_159541 [Gonapodya prolifera JEL478]|eukprot:KXS10279.1 hypothetical protein M427DRAFT_159541 [Gonapodya prolifera JEL478]
MRSAKVPPHLWSHPHTNPNSTEYPPTLTRTATMRGICDTGMTRKSVALAFGLLASFGGAAAEAAGWRDWAFGAGSVRGTGVLMVYSTENCTGKPDAFYLSHSQLSTSHSDCSDSIFDIHCSSSLISYSDSSFAGASEAAPLFGSKREGCVHGKLSVSRVIEDLEVAQVDKPLMVQGRVPILPPSPLYSIRTSFSPSPDSAFSLFSQPASGCSQSSLRETEAWLAHGKCSPLWTLPEAKGLEVRYWVKNDCGSGWRWYKDPGCAEHVGGGAYLPFGGCFESVDGFAMDECASSTAPLINDPTSSEYLPPKAPKRLPPRDTSQQRDRLHRRQTVSVTSDATSASSAVPTSSANAASSASSSAAATSDAPSSTVAASSSAAASSSSSSSTTSSSAASSSAPATTSAAGPQDSGGGGGLSTPAIIGIAAGGAVGALIVLCGLYMMTKPTKYPPPKGLGTRRPGQYEMDGSPYGSGRLSNNGGSGYGFASQDSLIGRNNTTRPTYAVPATTVVGPASGSYDQGGYSQSGQVGMQGEEFPPTNPNAPYANMFRNGKVYAVVQAYTPTMPDELNVQPNDSVTIVEQYEDGWAYATNNMSGASGVLPMVTLLPQQGRNSMAMGMSQSWGGVGSPQRTASMSRSRRM